MFKATMTAVLLALPLCAFAADEAKSDAGKALSPQQQKMGSCNKEAAARSLKGDERKKFMSDCLSADKKPTSPRERMSACNKDAGDKQLKGDERKKFMSDCLKAS